MLICHVITGLWDGGAEAALYRLCTAPTPAGQRHVVISLTAGGVYAKRLGDAGVSVFALDMPRGELTAAGVARCRRIMRMQKPDLVQTWMYHADLVGGLVASLQGSTPIVWGLRHANLDPSMHSRSTLRVVRACALLSRWLPDRIVSCSEAAIAVHRSAGYDTTRFVVIPNGYPLERFAGTAELRNRSRADLSLPDKAVVLGMAARFHRLKDHATLFAALRSIAAEESELVCLLAGSGMNSENEALMSLLRAADLTSRVRLLGSQEDVVSFMNAIDLHVLSSISEGFPNVLAEAMACHTPCVTTDAGDARLIVGNLGWIVPPSDPGALADGIRNALRLARNDPEGWQALRTRCRQRIEETFSLERMVAEYRNLWYEVIGARGGSQGADPEWAGRGDGPKMRRD